MCIEQQLKLGVQKNFNSTNQRINESTNQRINKSTNQQLKKSPAKQPHLTEIRAGEPAQAKLPTDTQ